MPKISAKETSDKNLEICMIAPVIPVLIINEIDNVRSLGEA